jgi:hypothetical protein
MFRLPAPAQHAAHAVQVAEQLLVQQASAAVAGGPSALPAAWLAAPAAWLVFAWGLCHHTHPPHFPHCLQASHHM